LVIHTPNGAIRHPYPGPGWTRMRPHDHQRDPRAPKRAHEMGSPKHEMARSDPEKAGVRKVNCRQNGSPNSAENHRKPDRGRSRWTTQKRLIGEPAERMAARACGGRPLGP